MIAFFSVFLCIPKESLSCLVEKIRKQVAE
jgi:hypothetical protein